MDSTEKQLEDMLNELKSRSKEQVIIIIIIIIRQVICMYNVEVGGLIQQDTSPLNFDRYVFHLS